jgi:hypothetical protein
VVYLHKRIILSKKFFVKRNWHRNKKCVFSYHDETIKNFFFWCKFASSICPVIQVDSNLYPPCNVAIFLATGYIESFTSLEFLITVRHYSTKFLRRRPEAVSIAPKCRRLRLNSRRRRYVVGIDWQHRRLLPLV